MLKQALKQNIVNLEGTEKLISLQEREWKEISSEILEKVIHAVIELVIGLWK